MQLYLNSSPRCSIQKKLKKSKMLYCSCHRDILFLTLTLFSFYESEKKFADPYHQIEKQKNKNTFTPRWPLETKKPQTVTKCISRRNKKKKKKRKKNVRENQNPLSNSTTKMGKEQRNCPPIRSPLANGTNHHEMMTCPYANFRCMPRAGRGVEFLATEKTEGIKTVQRKKAETET